MEARQQGLCYRQMLQCKETSPGGVLWKETRMWAKSGTVGQRSPQAMPLLVAT